MIRDKIKEIIDVLAKGEKEIQKIIGDAASKSDYTAVDAGRITAIEISKLQAKLDTLRKQRKDSGDSVVSQKMKILSKPSKISGYPKYEVQNDTLIRTGWSKKEGAEYAHSIPKSAFNSTIEIMDNLARRTIGPIKAEEIIKTIDNIESVEVPSYQVYVVIGMLRQKGCIKKLGRKGYEIPPGTASKARKEWEKMIVKK